MEEDDNQILHVCVVGFHHKKGCQLEYAYPPFIEGNPPDSNQLPEQWKHLPSMAIPDGAHNSDTDTIYFHLSALDGHGTVFGISCYRQVSAHTLVNRTADVTRGTVQKSVCVLSKLPLYGLIQAKLELITHAYFEELDFTKVSLLEETYANLSQSIKRSAIKGSQVFLGMSACDVVRKYRHSILVLFKLLLLERRVLFYMSPVEELNNIMLGLVSLFPCMIESGLSEAAGQPTPVYADELRVYHRDSNEYSDEYLELTYVRDCPDIIKAHVPMTSSDHRPSKAVTSSTRSVTSSTGSVTSSTRSVTSSADVDGSTTVEREEDGVGISHVSPTTKTTRDHKLKLKLSESRKEVPEQNQVSSPVSSSATYIQPPTDVVCQQPQPGTQPGPGTYLDKPNNSDPLADIEHLTSVQRIQNQPITDDHLPLDISLKNEEMNRVYNKEVISLDSTENVHQLDQEDCFSWEEDRLLLEIEEELIREKASEEKRRSAKCHDKSPVGNVRKTSKDKTGNVHSGNTVPDTAVPADGYRAATRSSPQRDIVGVHSPGLESRSRDGSRSRHGSRSGSDRSGQMVEHKSSWVTDECGFPLALFTKGSVCHPYLSLQYFGLLDDVNVRSFTIGATNILFKQKRVLTDVVIGDDESMIDIRDPELKKQLSLTTADLRFADYIVKNVCQESQDVFLDGTGWEGGEEWIRVQFRMYLMSLLITCKYGDEKLEEDFGGYFIHALKTTHLYKVWWNDTNVKLGQFEPGHPFHGQVSMSDMKLRWMTTMQNTGKGRKINAAVHNTGKAAVQAGKAVGGAFSTARSAVSGWVSGWSKENNK